MQGDPDRWDELLSLRATVDLLRARVAALESSTVRIADTLAQIVGEVAAAARIDGPEPITIRARFDHACPACGAARGRACRTAAGNVSHTPHAARRRLVSSSGDD